MKSIEILLTRNSIMPIIISKGSDNSPLSSDYESRS